MHCLGALAASQVGPSGTTTTTNTTTSNNTNTSSNTSSNNGSSSSSNVSNVSAVVGSVVRALGVLVCEGRIQGPPRGYKEGPHCVPPLQPQPNNHDCDKDNYLCDRYLVLVREIAERVSVGAYLCVEVVLCSDCPCGLIKSKSKHRVLSGPAPLTSWQHGSEMLLEYWRIGVVPSKSPEMMNCQGLYQAVRSRLHFSQVAAWWSRTNGARPSYIATRVVPQPGPPDEHLRRFRDQPVEHTFPLAGLGDGNSVEVSVWALPRMEDIPQLQCPMHPAEVDAESQLARPDTPVKRLVPTEDGPVIPTNPSPEANSNNSGNNQQQPNFVYYMSSFRSAVTPSQQEQQQQQQQQQPQPALLDDRLQIDCDKPGKHHCHCADEEDEDPSPPPGLVNAVGRPNERKRRRSLPCRPPEAPEPPPVQAATVTATATATATVAASSSSSPPGPMPVLQEVNPVAPSANQSPTTETATVTATTTTTGTSGAGTSLPEQSDALEGLERKFRTQLSIEGHLEKRYKRSDSNQQQQSATIADVHTHVPSTAKQGSRPAKQQHQNNSSSSSSSSSRVINVVVNPMCGSDEQQHPKKDKEQQTAASGILDWITRMPDRVLGAEQQQQQQHQQQQQKTKVAKCEVKMRNSCNLELSPREFDEVLAVLRSRTPRKRSTLGSGKRRDKYDRLLNETQQHQHQHQKPAESASKSKAADVLLGAILRSSSRDSERDEVITEVTRGWATTAGKNDSDETESAGSSAESAFASPESSSSGLESALNKRFSRLKQLFKRPEQGHQQQQTRLATPELDDGTSSSGCSSNGTSDSDRGSRPTKNSIPADSRAKRRIDFATDFSDLDNGDDEEDEEDEDDDDENCCGDDADDERFGGTPQNCDSSHSHSSSTHSPSIGTSTNSAHSIFHSTNRKAKRSSAQRQHLAVDKTAAPPQQQQQLTSRKSRGRRDFSPIRLIGDRSGYRNDDLVEVDEKSKSKNKIRNGVVVVAGDGESSIVKADGCSGAEESESGTEVEQDGAEGSDKTAVPSAKDQARFRRSLENAASMVFHSRTGLPLTSSPAPLRRGSCCFDFDSTLNSVSSKRSALFELNTPPSPGAVSLEECDREAESTNDAEVAKKRRPSSRNRPQSHALLGSFEESALNGRLEPVSTVHGFAAEIGASGSFCPKHRKLPVTVFFYTLGDNDKVSSPYLAHINLGKKPYQVPRMGTIQVTLLNPLGTVVKMFVVLYDLSDMPPRSHTFLRQRTLRDKTLRYLIHLRFMSGKSGRVYLHTDVRMIICRKADVDTASDFGSEPPKELRSYTHGPTNPKFSPRC